MVDFINYSVIIPHRNTPDLLKKCLNSIPRRKDIEIIVIDDNSDPKIVDFSTFPGLSDHFVKVLFLKEWKGPGFARNVGLEIAKGEWIIFADADDFFNSGFDLILEKYASDERDLIFFKTESVDFFTGQPSFRASGRNNSIDKAIAYGNWDILRYQANYPIGKFIKRKLIHENNIRFSEIKAGEEIMFSTLTGFHAQKISAQPDSIYTITTRADSLTGSLEVETCITIIRAACDAVDFLKKIGKQNHGKGLVISYWLKLFRIKKKEAILLLPKIARISGVFYLFLTLPKPLFFESLAFIKRIFPRTWNTMKTIKEHVV